jgi:predicted SPOUT superfamily RNA methylase MTH1
VVVFDNKSVSVNDHGVTALDCTDENESGAAFLTRILRYLETPQYLRRALFPKHNSLRFVVPTHIR